MPLRALALLLCIPALWLVRGGLGTGQYAGLAMGEVWGRLFVQEQVARWLTGTPVGTADLLSLGAGQSFWPTEPLTVAVGIGLRAVFGESTAWALLLATLSASAGLGGFLVARRGGASHLGALVAGLLVQLCPFWLRVGADGVTEALALGPPLWALWSGWRYLDRPTAKRLLVVAVTGLFVAGTSPYYAVYGYGVAVLTLPLWGRGRVGLALRVLGIWLAAGVVFVLPLVWAETGPGGRLSGSWVGGYRLVPDPLVTLEASGATSAPRPLPSRFDPTMGHRAHSTLQRWMVTWPGGVAVTLALLAGLGARRRGAAVVGLVVLLAGPAAALVWPGPPPLVALAARLPVLELLSNPERWVAICIVAAPLAVAPWLGADRRGKVRTALLAAVVLLAAWLETPPLALPAVDARADAFDGLSGGVVTFPDGDPPVWHREGWPKEALWRAAHHGAPVPYDYGRLRERQDLRLQARLSQVSGVAVGQRAAEAYEPDDEGLAEELRAAGIGHVLLVEHGLAEEQVEGAVRWLETWAGPPRAQVAGQWVFDVPRR